MVPLPGLGRMMARMTSLLRMSWAETGHAWTLLSGGSVMFGAGAMVPMWSEWPFHCQ